MSCLVPKLIAGLLLAGSCIHAANATNFTYDLSGDVSNLVISVGPVTSGGYLALVDSGVGLQLPGATLSVGDTISGTITLSSALTIPNNSSGNGHALIVQLASTDAASLILYDETSFALSNNGVQLSQPSGYSLASGTGPIFTLGLIPTSNTAPGFTFDQIAFNSTVTAMFDNNSQSIASVLMSSTHNYGPAQTDLNYTYPTAPVPEPETWGLIMSGLALVGTAVRHKKLA